MTDSTHRLFTGISQLLTMPRLPRGGLGSTSAEAALGLIEDAAILVDTTDESTGGTIIAAGTRSKVSALHPDQVETIDLGGAVVLPGLVDCHTHLVYAGDRTADYAARCAGATYQQIAAAGGGIRLTVGATRAATLDNLVSLARPRLEAMLSRGVTTVEVKSGYGLTAADELKMLHAIATLDRQVPQDLIATCLAAHMVPDEYAERRQDYVDLVCETILPEAKEIASFADVFCDVGAFSLEETATILAAARTLGMGLKVHGEQLTHTGVGRLAAQLGATSLDHAEQLAITDIPALASAGTVAVLLPGASVFLGDTARPPARALIDAGVQVAVATDCNPGSSPTTDLWLMGILACSWYGLRPHEALRGMTIAAAAALALTDRGTLAAGTRADFAVCDVPNYKHLLYQMGHTPVTEAWIGGRLVWQAA